MNNATEFVKIHNHFKKIGQIIVFQLHFPTTGIQPGAPNEYA